MLFNSFDFLFFLPLVLAVCYVFPAPWRWAVLLIASYIFYGWTDPANLAFLGGVTLITYAGGAFLGGKKAASARRMVLIVGLVLVLGSLAAFKFCDFLAGEIERLARLSWHLPRLGISAPPGYSFYAFSAAGYLIDVYRRTCSAAGPGSTALYLAYFPKILAGPIERATSFLPQLAVGLRSDPARGLLGLQLIGWGLVKKVLIADSLAPLVDRIFAIAAFASPMELLISVYFFAFQIYCDFSGYTDIAIGVALLFGIVLAENFRRPYLSCSVGEFWSTRWHISLAHWFRDYLYFSLGGSRAGPLRTCFNIMTIFIVSGLWHAGLGYGVGWTFLIWGVLNGLFVCCARMTQPVWRLAAEQAPALAKNPVLSLFRIVLTFHLIAATWVFFRAASVKDAMVIMNKIAGLIPDLPTMLVNYPFGTEHVTGFALILGLMIFEVLDERRSVPTRLAAAPLAVRWSAYYATIFGLLLFGHWQAREFIYMQF